MSLKIKVSSVSLRTTPLGIKGNTAKIISALEADMQSDVILFPELSLTGYSCEDVFYNSWLWDEAFAALEKLLPYSSNRAIIVGLPVFKSPYLYNCSVVLYNGAIAGIVPKRNLANTGIHYEKRWFAESDIIEDKIMLGGKEYPFGNLLFDFGGVKIGMEICEDSWVSERNSSAMAIHGADIILSPGASHFAIGKHEIRKRIFAESSRAQNNVFIFANILGNESGKVIFDGGSMIYAGGQMIAGEKRFSYKDFTITSAVVSIADLHSLKAKFFHRYKKMPANHKTLALPALTGTREPVFGQCTTEDLSPYAEFSKACGTGLYDYLLKTRCNGYTISLSGGADSAACAILVHKMIHEAKKELGDDCFTRTGLSEAGLVHTIYQKTVNNSNETEEIASRLSRELGFRHFAIAIDDLVKQNINLIETATNRKLAWETDDISLQNIQARTRAPLVWLLANMYNHLLISTGNRSEAATGYMTMDGDTAGSLSPIAGVSKEFILKWLEVTAEETGLVSLQQLLNTNSSAELQPLAMKQEDEKDLMPYEMLQKIEKEYVLYGKHQDAIISSMLIDYKEYPEAEIIRMVDKFIRLFKRSQWKREKLSPPFHMDEYGLDPKSSYRFPILSSE